MVLYVPGTYLKHVPAATAVTNTGAIKCAVKPLAGSKKYEQAVVQMCRMHGSSQWEDIVMWEIVCQARIRMASYKWAYIQLRCSTGFRYPSQSFWAANAVEHSGT